MPQAIPPPPPPPAAPPAAQGPPPPMPLDKAAGLLHAVQISPEASRGERILARILLLAVQSIGATLARFSRRIKAADAKVAALAQAVESLAMAQAAESAPAPKGAPGRPHAAVGAEEAGPGPDEEADPEEAAEEAAAAWAAQELAQARAGAPPANGGQTPPAGTP